METEVIHTTIVNYDTTRKGKSILLYFSPYSELFRRIDVFPIQTLIITPLRNVMLTVTRELGLSVLTTEPHSFPFVFVVCFHSVEQTNHIIA